MKTALICFGLMAVIFASADAGKLKAGAAQKAKQDYMNELVGLGLKYLKKALSSDITLPIPIKDHVVLPNYDINMELSDVVLSNMGDLVVNEIHNNASELTTAIDFTLKSPSAKGTYNIAGVAFTHNVQGSGEFTANNKNLNMKALIQLSVTNHTLLHVDNLEVTYEVEEASFAFQNMKVEGVSDEQVKEFLNTNLLASVEKSKDIVSQKIAALLQQAANAILDGKNLVQLSKWLRFATQ